MNTIMQMNGRGICNIATGLGKTPIQFSVLQHHGGFGMIVMQSNKLPDYARECTRITGKVPFILRGKASIAKFHTRKCDIVLCSYNTAKLNMGFLNSIKWTSILLDEGHSLKGDRSVVSQELCPLLARTPVVFFFSATIFTKSASDVFNSLRVLYPRYFPCRELFTRRYCGGRFNPVLNQWELTIDFDNPEELALLLRTKRMMMCVTHEMAVKIAEEVNYPVPDHLRLMPPLPVEIVRFTVPPEVTCLRGKLGIAQRADDTNSNVLEVARKTGLIKQRYMVKKVFEEIARTPIGQGAHGLFCKHHTVLDYYKEQCEKRGVSYVAIDGTVPVPKRDALVADVNAGKVQVAIMTYDAAGTGLNIRGITKGYHLELSWMYSMMEQADGRYHRTGQTKPTKSFVYIAEGSFDETMWAMMCRRRKNIETILSVLTAPFWAARSGEKRVHANDPGETTSKRRNIAHTDICA
jgi:superfamily II DNA or RNA helicase